MKDDLRSDKSIKRAEAFTVLWLQLFVCTHTGSFQAERINSGLKSPNEPSRPPAASLIAEKLRLSGARPGLLISDHRNKRVWPHVLSLRTDFSGCRPCRELRRRSSAPPPPFEGKLIHAIPHNSFNTYQKFMLHHDLSTSHSCVGNIYPHFSWMTMTKTPTVNHLRR